MAAKSGRRTKGRDYRNREEEVIAAAIKIFSEKGFAATSIQDVADEVGVLKGSLYHYIESKEDLLFQIFDESHRQAAEIVREIGELEGPPLDRLHTYIQRYVHWYLDNVDRVSIYFSEWRHLTGQRLATVKKQRRMYEKVVFELIEEARDAGNVPEDLNPTYATNFILGAVNGVPVWYRPGRGNSLPKISAAYADMVVGTLVGTRISA